MTRFAEAHTSQVDKVRTQDIRKAAEREFAAPFEAIQAKAAQNIKAMSAKRTWALY